jgi:hypothetical protein
MFSPSVKRIAARLGRQRVHQKTATLRVPGNYLPLSRLKVEARLLVVPSGGARRKSLQPKRCANRMANVTASVAWTLGQKDGLYASLKELEIQSRCYLGGSRRLRERRSRCDNQKHKSHKKPHSFAPDFTLRIVEIAKILRLPRLSAAAPLRRVESHPERRESGSGTCLSRPVLT